MKLPVLSLKLRGVLQPVNLRKSLVNRDKTMEILGIMTITRHHRHYLIKAVQRPENDRRNALFQLPAGIEPENDRADIEDISDVSPLITSLQPRGSQQF